MRNGAVLALWLLPLWATGDALLRPTAAFRTVRHRKLLWLLPGPLAVAAWFVGDAWPILIGLALLLIAIYNRPLFQVLQTEQFAAELIRTMVGSIGLILAVPLTTAIGVAVVRASRTARPARVPKGAEPTPVAVGAGGGVGAARVDQHRPGQAGPELSPRPAHRGGGERVGGEAAGRRRGLLADHQPQVGPWPRGQPGVEEVLDLLKRDARHVHIADDVLIALGELGGRHGDYFLVATGIVDELEDADGPDVEDGAWHDWARVGDQNVDGVAVV